MIHCEDGHLKKGSKLHRAYDPLQYSLMFVKDGYYLTCTRMQSYAYRMMFRADCFNALQYYKDLFSQYCVDMIAKMITERLNYI